MKIKKTFTLIELIVVIVVIGVLAAIVIPNISSFREEAEEKAILADARNIQSAVDMFMMKNNGKTPTKDIPTIGDPQVVETYAMKPDYLRSLPKTTKAKFWLDYSHTVWGSTVDAPQNVNYVEGKVTWDSVDGAVTYKIYKSTTDVLSSVKGYKELTFLRGIKASKNTVQHQEVPSLEKGIYLVSAVDKYGFEGPVVRVDSPYDGYGDGPEKELTVDFLTKPRNQSPDAVLMYSPMEKITTNTIITWDYSMSSDPEGDTIESVEWKLNGIPLSVLPPKLQVGEQVVGMRVKDSKGNWSDWTYKELFVEVGGFTPTTISSMSAFGQLSYSTDSPVILTDSDPLEVLYYPTICCVSGSFIKDTFSKDGTLLEKQTITGYTGPRTGFAASNKDEEGNRYLLTNSGQIFVLSPDNKATSLTYIGHHLSRNTYNQIAQISIEKEGDILYIGYTNGSSLSYTHLAAYNLKEQKLIYNKLGNIGYISESKGENIIVTDEFVYTGGLTGSEGTNTSIYILQWEKQTGILKNWYTWRPPGGEGVVNPVIFKDSNEGIWYSYARHYQDGNRVEVRRVDTVTMKSIVQTVKFPDLYTYKVSKHRMNEDGTIDLFQFSSQKTLRKSQFK